MSSEDFLDNFDERVRNALKYIPDGMTITSKDIEKARNTIAGNDFERKTLSFTLLGEPKAWSRAAKQKTGGQYYDSNTGYKSNILDQLFKQFPEEWKITINPVSIKMLAYKAIPKKYKGHNALLAEMGFIRPDNKPDVDNYAKNIQDALNSFFYKDDSQVIDLNVSKYYSFKPRIELEITY